jgi:hypothetical protein
VVVQGAEQRRVIGDIVKSSWRPLVSSEGKVMGATERRMREGVNDLSAHFADIPVIVVICGSNVYQRTILGTS